jgi:ABC-type multidrug transport system, ATPase component
LNSLVTVKSLSKKYNDFKLDNISLEIPEGAVMGLIGANGAGKTTLIRLLTNMCQRDEGEILIFSKDNLHREREVKQHLGIVYDSNYFCDNWKISTCETAVKGFFSSWDSLEFKKMISRFDLNPKQRVNTLSRGMAMKMMLAIALSHKAKLLILDEPTSGLDPFVRDDLMRILYEYTQRSGCGVLFSTHITSDLEKIATHITFLHRGTLIYTGTKKDFTNTFVGITGQYGSLTDEQKRAIIGIKNSSNMFEGMIKSEKKEMFKKYSTSTLLMEQIMLYIKQGDENNHGE